MTTRIVWFVLSMAPVSFGQLAREWQTVRSPHFEFISRYETAKVEPIVQELEWARAVFEENFSMKSRLDRPALVVLPDSPFEYERMSPKYTAGYFAGAAGRDLIALKELENWRHVLLHEYTHLVMHHQGAGRAPLWFQEGAAEFYATMKPAPGAVVAGASNPARSSVIRKGAWLPVSFLVTIRDAAEFTSADAGARFYAQSWLYVHMLQLAPGYAGGYARLRSLLLDGVSTQAALKQTYSKTLVQFDDDAREWFRQERLPVTTLRSPSTGAARLEKRTLEPLDVEIAMSTIAVQGPRKRQAAAEHARLARQAGTRCERQAALGDLALVAGLYSEAMADYQAAIACGYDRTELSQGLAEAIAYRQDATPKELEAVAALAGGTGRHRYLLGRARFFARDAAGALQEFERASGLTADEQFNLLRMKAMIMAGEKRFDEAREAAAQLQAMARDEEQKANAKLTLQDLERKIEEAATISPEQQLWQGLERLEGALVRIDCLGQQARLWVRAGAATRKLLIADPNSVTTNTENGSPFEMRCGAQSRKVVVGFEPGADTPTGTEGRVRVLQLF
ncbi:MAG: tetratricopeptide repeat protein [Bryobacteraceae bacterium]|nr:tetratricopeptide repeat protein [Bryobacteraceae bacterium]